MPPAFSHSLRALEGDRSHRALWICGGAIGLLGLWACWFFIARITLYEVSAEARLEVDRDVHPVAAPVSGRIVAMHLVLGQAVTAGDVLVQLDCEIEKRRLEEERRRLAAVVPQLAALKREMLALEQTLKEDRDALHSGLESARARQKEAEVASRFAEEEARRLSQLKDGIAELDRLRFRAEEQKKQASTQALTLEVQRREADERARDSQGRARHEQLIRDAAFLEGQLSTSTATISVLEQEIERHTIRAPMTGQIGEVAASQIGAVVREGARIASVVPAGDLRAVAAFSPASALGRIRAGQPARVRLDGFPWTEFGSVPARVVRVATETRDGRMRVELRVMPEADSLIPMQHGLSGSVEIEVERVSPAALLLRATGQLLARPARAPPIVAPSEPAPAEPR